MLEALTALSALQALDSAAEAARKFINDVPAQEQALEAQVATAQAAVDAAKARTAENDTARRALEKDVAAVDARLARFEDHKAAVKTNQEFHALNHEIELAQAEKTKLEDQIIEFMETGESLAASLKAAQVALADERRAADEAKAALHAERQVHQAELDRLAGERRQATIPIPADLLAKYDQLAKNRKGLAVVPVVDGHCTACNVRLRPHAEQQVRRSESIVTCDSCQRMLYYVPPAPADEAAPPASPS